MPTTSGLASSVSSGHLLLGAVLLSAAVVDLLWTTLWVEGGAGPLTSGLMATTWRALRRIGNREPRVLVLTGPVLLVAGLVTWIALLWGGWVFVLAGVESALVDTVGRGGISWSDRVYFVGYAVFTLGNGDFAPRSGVPQVVTTLASASGMLFVTLSVTYVISVLDAVTQKRSFASDVSGLGPDGAGIVRTSWNGAEFEALDVTLDTVASELNTLTSNHKAYPILHYFYSRRARHAPASQIPVLDEALTLLRFGVEERARPPETVLRSARSGVENYLDTLGDTFITPADCAPPLPDLGSLRETRIPVVPDDEFAASVGTLEERRRTLLGLVESDVREWPSSDG